MTNEIKSLLSEFNRNVEWLKENHQFLTPNTLEELPDWIDIVTAKNLLQRSRTWIRMRMIQPDDVSYPMNTNWFLIYGVDWHREGSKIVFARQSVQRLKNELRSMGENYQRNKRKMNQTE
ncbi:MAG: hypothetical protein WCH59_09105 [Chitinophagia bacterium]|jgi:hypothetical protein